MARGWRRGRDDDLSWPRRAGLIAVLGLALLVNPPPTEAADNAAKGGIGGIDNGTLAGGDGTGTARVTLTPVDLALVKQARDQAGIVLPDGAPVSPGQTLYFVLYLDNPTLVPASDARILDLLDESQFTYVPGTLTRTLAPSGSTAASIWAGSWSPLTDATGPPDDEACATNTGGPSGPDRITIGADPAQTNLKVDVPPGMLLAIRFQVRVN